jgi:4,5-DOPA dioxygenase extradiol
MMGPTMPAVFLGHGNPMNAIQQNAWTRSWAAIGAALPRPKAVLCVSAHWYLPATAVTAMAQPRTIHDFGGFPPELHRVQYPAPGAPDLAARVAQLLQPTPVALDRDWGLDHGSWSVLRHVYPDADIPIIQLSIDETKAASWHFETAKKLAPLRDEGVLIVGSGNLVHNLHTYSWGNPAVEPYDWAIRFETLARKALATADFMPLVNYQSLGRDAMLSAPTPDHYLPLLYVLAQHRPGEPISFPAEGFDGGSISMLSVQLG